MTVSRYPSAHIWDFRFAGGSPRLLKRGIVMFWVARNLAVNHLPMERGLSVQTCTSNRNPDARARTWSRDFFTFAVRGKSRKTSILSSLMIYSPRRETRYWDSAGNGIACPGVQIVGTVQRDVRGKTAKRLPLPLFLFSLILRYIPLTGYNTRQKSWNTCVRFPSPMLTWLLQSSNCSKIRVRTLLSFSNSMTFHDFFHNLFKPASLFSTWTGNLLSRKLIAETI